MLKKTSYLLVLLIAVASCKSVEKYNQEITKKHTLAALHHDVDKIYKRLKQDHPRLYQYTSKEQLDFKFDSLKQAINTPLTSSEFYKKIAPVIKVVGQGHISVVPPSERRTRQERKEYRNKKFALNNFDFTYIENKLLVSKALGADTVYVGSEVLTVGDESPKKLIDQYNKNISSDGYNTTLFESFVGTHFLKYYLKDKGFQDSLVVKFKRKDSLFDRTFAWKKPEKKNDSVKVDSLKISAAPKKLGRKERKIRKLKRKKTRKDRSKFGYDYSRNENRRNLDFIGQDSTVAYMKIRTFLKGNYKAFYKESFHTLDSLGIQDLIIDLRNNPGGRVVEINELYKYLAQEEFKFVNRSEVTTRLPMLNMLTANANPLFLRVFSMLVSPIIITHNLLKTSKKGGQLYYKLKQTKPQMPHENNFKGDVYVLINGNSFSASSILSTHLKATGRATFVGQETGGAYNGTVAGLFKVYELPASKIKVRMGLLQVEAPYKQTPDGYGVKPDVEIKPTYADFIADKDAALEWILETIQNNK